MYVRLTFITSLPNKVEEATKIFNEEVVPVVKQQKGNIDIVLIQSTDDANESISYTSWESQAHAAEYEGSGLYKELVDKVRHTFAKSPILKTYTSM